MSHPLIHNGSAKEAGEFGLWSNVEAREVKSRRYILPLCNFVRTFEVSLSPH